MMFHLRICSIRDTLERMDLGRKVNTCIVSDHLHSPIVDIEVAVELN